MENFGWLVSGPAIFIWYCFCYFPAIDVINGRILTQKEGVGMKRAFIILLIFCLMICALSGCQKEAEPLCRFVVEMEISGQHQDLQFTKNYTDTQIIEAVLNCLRSVKSRNKVVPVKETAQRNYFLVSLRLSDGAIRTYALAGHRYFKAPKKPWVELNPEIAAKFYSILRSA